MEHNHSATEVDGESAKDRRKPNTVLLVDDDPDFRFQQKHWLKNAGFDVVEAASEAEAQTLLNNGQFHIAVLDLMMDNPDGGFTLAYQIKKRWPNMPVIMVSSVNAETGLQFGTDTEAARSWIKADAFLSKPIRLEQLSREIDRLLGV